MKYKENTDGLPAPLWSLLQFSDYTKGDSEFSVTDLIKPPQVVQLLKRHQDEIEHDPRENIYRVLGSSVHSTLEKVGLENPEDSQMIEERLHAEVLGTKISGQIDLHTTFEHGILTDWKHCKTSVLKYETKDEWVIQLNCYAHLLRLHGYDVTGARVCAIFRDWSQSGINGKWKVSTTDGVKIVCNKVKDYPEWGCAIIEIPLWKDQDVAAYIAERIELHNDCKNLPDEELPECSPDDRWRRDTWRVRKIGFVKAKGNNSKLKSEEEALEYLEKMGPEFEISRLPGVPYRCAFYCDVAPFCSQLKREGFEVVYQEEVPEEAEI